MTQSEYIDLVDFTGRELHPGKRGVIKMEPKAFLRLGLDKKSLGDKSEGLRF